MLPAVRRAVPVAALLVCLLTAAGAHAQQASPTPQSQPPLTGRPPVALATATPTATATPAPSATATPEATPRRSGLARTGSDAGLIGLAGASLLGMGLTLRRLVELDGAV